MNTRRREELSQVEKRECFLLKQIYESKKKALGLSQLALGGALDISQGGVSHYLNGANALNVKIATAFARVLQVDIAEFSPRLAALLPHQGGAPEGHIRIPVLDISAQAGIGGEPNDYPAVKDYMDLMEGYVRNTLRAKPESLCILPAKGDSMAPTIQDGDLLFVDTSINHFDEEGIYVIIWCGALLVKRLAADYSSRHIEIRSDNAIAYPAKLVLPERMDELTIRGKVRAWWSLKKH